MSSQGGDQQGAGGSSWWGWGDTILQTVKKQSETIISIYKEDLSEFTRTIKEDTISVVKEVVKQEEGAAGSSTSASSDKKRPNAAAAGRSGISTSSSGLSNFFNFMDSLKDEEEEEVLAKSRREKGVKKLQKDINTYTQPPADEEDFKEWKAGFNLEARTVEISQLLSANNKLRAIHNELLPKLTYSVFWERYYYRLEKLLKDEERREKILMRAELDSKLDDWGGWEDDEEGEGAVEAATDETSTGEAVGEEAKKDVEEEEEVEQDDGVETDTQGEETTSASTAPEPAADEPTPVEDAAQRNAAEGSSASAEEVAPVEEEAAAPQGAKDKNAAEQREVVAGDLPKEDAAPEEEEENEDEDVLLDVEDLGLVPTSPQEGEGEGDDDWDAWE